MGRPACSMLCDPALSLPGSSAASWCDAQLKDWCGQRPDEPRCACVNAVQNPDDPLWQAYLEKNPAHASIPPSCIFPACAVVTAVPAREIYASKDMYGTTAIKLAASTKSCDRMRGIFADSAQAQSYIAMDAAQTDAAAAEMKAAETRYRQSLQPSYGALMGLAVLYIGALGLFMYLGRRILVVNFYEEPGAAPAPSGLPRQEKG